MFSCLSMSGRRGLSTSQISYNDDHMCLGGVVYSAKADNLYTVKQFMNAVWNQLDRTTPSTSRQPVNSRHVQPRAAEAVSGSERLLSGIQNMCLNSQKRNHANCFRSSRSNLNHNINSGSKHEGENYEFPRRRNDKNHYTDKKYNSNQQRVEPWQPFHYASRNLQVINHSLRSRQPYRSKSNFNSIPRVAQNTKNPNVRPAIERPISQGRRGNFHQKQYRHNFQTDNENILQPKGDYVSKPYSFPYLEELVTKPSNEILLIINNTKGGYFALLEQKDISIDKTALICIALGKSCLADMNSNIARFLNSVSNNSDFLITGIPKYLVQLRLHALKTFHFDSLLYFTIFLQKFQQTLAASSVEPISILLPLMKSTCDKILKSHIHYDDVNNKLADIDEQNTYNEQQHGTNAEVAKMSRREKQQLMVPPENYRFIPVLPNAEDVQSHYTFLRPNIVKGKYSDTDHYLDVQYRLLREDYVRPLRNGIGDYLMLKEKGRKDFKNVRDVRVYQNVHIVKQDFVNGGIVHIASFSETSFSNIKWEYSKRFLTGSLLCFSSDDFKTMLFASVANRIPENLKKGLLLIRFEEVSDEVLNISPLTSFTVIETTAYFEAYRHNLKALLDLNADNLPFQKYIVDVQNKVDAPVYLQNTTTYDMRPLLIPLEEKYIKHSFDANGGLHVDYEYPSNIDRQSKSIHILNDSTWPSEQDLNLDHSQFLALKAAITKEFTVIQGPPGTGKTYIGLRIVQLLLHNINKWLIHDTNSLPILVVCYTNHALDQFLEGLMLFTHKIIRIGGRGTNEALTKFHLSEVKRCAINKKEIPKYISMSMWHKNNELRSLKREIDIINTCVNKSVTTVLGEDELRNEIPIHQYDSLKSIKNDINFKINNLSDDGFLTHDWLGIRSRYDDWNDYVTEDLHNVQQVEQKPLPEINKDEDDVESIGEVEGDIEFIEAQRDINADDFEGVSFDIDTPETNEQQFQENLGWKVQGGKKQRLKNIKKHVTTTVPFEETEALRITNVWKLNIVDRWKLYKYWLEKYINAKKRESMIQQQHLKTQYQEVCEMRTEENIFVLQKAHVVGMTTTGAAKYRNIILRLNPRILVVEEAAEILESHIVTSLAPKTQHVILIGDHQQLRPSPTVYQLAVNYDLNISLFERMLKNSMECFRLSIQHRMRPEIAELIVPHIYVDLKNHESVTKFEDIKGVSKNVFFVTHNYNERKESDSTSKINDHEAGFLIKLCTYFILQGYDASKITVLTTYTGQLYALKKLITPIIKGVRMTAVDNYQGEENDIILISFVRSNFEGDIGFLKVSNRVCVALSRAKKGLFCVGNFGLLAEKSDLWKNIIQTLHQKQEVGPSLQLMCQNHPGVSNVVSNAKDFDIVPEGGCSRLCDYRLSCGHVCSLMCHPYDKAHENIRCQKECKKSCVYGHKCSKKCYEKCGKCTHVVDKVIYPCNHKNKVQCHLQDENIMCQKICDKILPCGHNCVNKCSETCVMVCKHVVKIKSSICGHDISLECCFANQPEKQIEKCLIPCRKLLSCGHSCGGYCSKCHQGRLHVSCNKPCRRILVCGHECRSPCSKSCPPCVLPCENRCVHSKCPKTCGEPCEECIEPCEWSCEHKKCSRPCGQMCSRVPCNMPCYKTLPCKHPCIGFCGEPCPEECRECNSDIVTEIFFGSEDDQDARFVQLEDCKHILEISGLSQWMTLNSEGNQIQMKACPKCKTVIRRNLRFGNVVKDCLKQIGKVKAITFGNVDRNKELQNKLLGQVEDNFFSFEKVKNGSLIFDSWIKCLSSRGHKSIQQITTMENIVNAFFQLSESIIPIYLSMATFSTDIDQDNTVKDKISNLSKFLKSSAEWIFDFLQDEYLTASEQQLQQLTWEIHRLKLGVKFLNFSKERLISITNLYFVTCVTCLTKYSAFEDKDFKVFTESFKSLAESCGSAIINVSDLEKQSILKAMGLTKGHWYQCPNGHVYCITECGGATQEGRCNECNERIGGSNHSLLRTNRVATEMDGSRHSAWSDAANMRNYDFDNLQ